MGLSKETVEGLRITGMYYWIMIEISGNLVCIKWNYSLAALLIIIVVSCIEV